MTKQVFLNNLKQRLSVLPEVEIQKTINFYNEIIDDRIEDGYDEQIVINELGSIDKIIDDIFEDYTLTKIIDDKIDKKTKSLSTSKKVLIISLLVLTSPITLPIIFSIIIAIISIYIGLVSIIFGFGVAIATLAFYSVYSCFSSIIYLTNTEIANAIFVLGTGFISAGIFITILYLYLFVVKKIFKLHSKLYLKTKTKLLGGSRI